MKILLKILTIFILLAAVKNNTCAQDVSLGLGLNIPFGNKAQTMGFGVHFVNEYCFYNQYSARLNASASLSGLNGDRYMGTDSYGFEELEASFLYYFMKNNFRPYAGIGIGYYVPNTSTSSNANVISGSDEMVGGNEIENNYGVNFIAGMKFNSLKFFSFGMEMKYNYVKTNWSADVIGPRGSYVKDLGRIDLSQLIFNANFIFNL